MPELPEVETVKATLEKVYLNKTIKSVAVLYPKILANISQENFQNKLEGQTIQSFSRKGKFIIINLSNSTLLIHLRMEGKFKFSHDLLDKHSHIVFYFIDDSVLIYHDVRKFGRIYYFDKGLDIFALEPLNRIGPEPMEIKDANYLLKKYKNIKKPIKSTLLDQSIMAGLGNIYADEVCFACKLNPMTPANKINLEKCQEIVTNSCLILTKAIQYGGSTIKTFQSAHGVDGLFQLHIHVYGKENQPCPICHQRIIKTFVNKRGTHYCPNCQKG